MRTSKIKIFVVLCISLVSVYCAVPTFFPTALLYVPDYLRPQPVNLGLDLKGGVSLTIEVAVDNYFDEYTRQHIDTIVSAMSKNKLSYARTQIVANGFDLYFGSNKHDDIVNLVYNTIGEENFDISVKDDKLEVRFQPHLVQEVERSLIAQSIEIVRRRIDESGTKEIDIQQQGARNILVQVPGISDPAEIKRLLGRTAKLSFHIVEHGTTVHNLAKHQKRSSLKVVELDNQDNTTAKHRIVVQNRPVLTGDMLVDAQVSFHLNAPAVSFKLNNAGARIFGDASLKHLGKSIAILLDDKVLSAPTIKEPILGGTGVISGNFSVASANELALLLRAGALPVPLIIAEERVVGPSLGSDSIKAGTNATIIGAITVSVVMVLFYGIFGIIADIALFLNVFAIVSCFTILGATLTLPGIAGIVLTLGMAVDANVLIYERIREELRNQKSNSYAIESGYKIAFATILDANITSMICALILYFLGAGSVKSFAISFLIGIVCSIFTAVALTKVITALWYTYVKPKTLYL